MRRLELNGAVGCKLIALLSALQWLINEKLRHLCSFSPAPLLWGKKKLPKTNTFEVRRTVFYRLPLQQVTRHTRQHSLLQSVCENVSHGNVPTETCWPLYRHAMSQCCLSSFKTCFVRSLATNSGVSGTRLLARLWVTACVCVWCLFFRLCSADRLVTHAEIRSRGVPELSLKVRAHGDSTQNCSAVKTHAGFFLLHSRPNCLCLCQRC